MTTHYAESADKMRQRGEWWVHQDGPTTKYLARTTSGKLVGVGFQGWPSSVEDRALAHLYEDLCLVESREGFA